MEDLYIKTKKIQECLKKFSEEPNKGTIDALTEVCDAEKKNFWDAWGTIAGKKLISSEDVLSSICIEAFYSGKTKVLDVFNKMYITQGIPYPVPSFNNVIQTLTPHINTAIINGTHTETLKQLLVKNGAALMLMDSELFKLAVYSDNYPIVNHIQQIEPQTITFEMMKDVAENYGYDRLDMLLGNGKYIKESDIINRIIINALCTGDMDSLEWIHFLAERYVHGLDKNKEAERRFIEMNSDIDNIIYYVYKTINNISNDISEAVLDYFIRVGVKLKNASGAIVGYASKGMYGEQLISLMNEDTYICYEDIAGCYQSFDNTEEIDNITELLKKYRKKFSHPLRMSLCKKEAPGITKKKLTLLRQLLKFCSVESVSKPAYYSVIDYAVSIDKNAVIRDILEADFLINKNAIEEMINMCIEHRSHKCLNEINKYCQRRKEDE